VRTSGGGRAALASRRGKAGEATALPTPARRRRRSRSLSVTQGVFDTGQKSREISKFNTKFARLTSNDIEFVSLSKYNLEAHELFYSGDFDPFSTFLNFLLLISSPAQVK
jgi:hypothetical protein